MSWQAQTAVNHHSKINDMKLFRLLLYLAECADDNGRIDPAPNQDTLAEFYGVSSRTIRNWLNTLCDSGELEQTRVGSGPGNPSAYQIALHMPDKGGNKAETNTADISIFESFMVEIKAEIDTLKAEILALKVEKVETKGGKGGNERRKDDSFKSADDPFDPSFDPKEEIPPTPKRKRRAVLEMPSIPEKLNTGGFVVAWGDYVTHRQEIKSPLTPLAAKKQLNQLEEWGVVRAIAAINHSIAKGWKAIYEPDKYQNGRSAHNPTRPQPAPESERVGGFY